jgi:hypothetical protein
VTLLESKYNNNSEILCNNQQYGGRCSMSSVPMVNPWWLVVAKNTRKWPWTCKTCYIHTYSFHWSSLCINCIWIWNMSINIRQHKAHRKIHSQDERVKQNKTYSQESTKVLLHVIIHNGTITCIRLILITFEIFRSSSYKLTQLINIKHLLLR